MPQDQMPAKTSRRPNLARKRSAPDSARTSFALNPEAMEAMDWLVERLHSPKEVFRTLEGFLLGELLDDLFEESNEEPEGDSEVHAPDMAEPGNSIRKSFVIGGQTLQILNKVARRKKIKRDVLVNQLLIGHKNWMEAKYKELFKKQKQAQKLLHDVIAVWDNAMGELGELLEKDDPLYRAFFTEFLYVQDRVVATVDGMLATGEPITDPFDTRYE